MHVMNRHPMLAHPYPNANKSRRRRERFSCTHARKKGRKIVPKMNQVYSPNVLLYCPEWLTSLTPSFRMYVFIAHTISYPHRMGEICAQTKHSSAETLSYTHTHPHVGTLEAAAATVEQFAPA